MVNQDLGPLFYRELAKIKDRCADDQLAQIDGCYQLLNAVFIEATKAERLRFSTLFSRVAFASQKYKLSRTLQFYLHAFRKQATEALRQKQIAPDKAYLTSLGYRVLLECIQSIFQSSIPADWQADLETVWPYPLSPVEIQEFKPFARVVALEDDPLCKQFIVKDEKAPDIEIRMQYDIAEYNELFNRTITQIRSIFGFPVILALIDVQVDQEGIYRPQGIVVEPDYLMDVTAIAECFKDTGTIPESNILRKFLPIETKAPLLLGQIANLFLDELIHTPEAAFRKTFTKAFQINPLQFAIQSDDQVKKLFESSQKHFIHLKKVIAQDIPALGIQPEATFLEPSFYSQEYGLQGRLDLFYKKGNTSAIIELKSNKPFRPNIYGLASNNYVQTLLYDLIIRSVFGKKIDPSNYILYSVLDDRQLKYAPVIKTQQFEALQVRNSILSFEHQLALLGSNATLGNNDILEQGWQLFRSLQPDHFNHKFTQTDAERLQNVLRNTDELEQRYFFAFCGFIAREHKLAKTGVEGIEQLNGQAALWRNSTAEKEASFDLLANLKILQNHANAERPTLLFARNPDTDALVNFRTGDIVLLYPAPADGNTPLGNQLFKCTIIELTPDIVRVELRARQTNDQLFKTTSTWNLEHDLMDNGFTNMYRGLFDFISASPRQRQLLLGRIPPEQAPPVNTSEYPLEMTAEQGAIFNQISVSKDYFLLWGPPGTGKTSVMVKHLAGYWLSQSSETILLLAYTNRAVDEICAAIESYHPSVRENYLRIGSRYSTAVEYQDRLLSVQTEKIETRKQLRALIDAQRIIVGTVSSLLGKQEMFELKTFDRVLIDEASQIPEPMLIGLLPKFKQVTLIGDHKQLPAVVTQDDLISAVDDSMLRDLGISNLRNSLFERLYKQCQANGWHWAYAQLSHQGRMHQDIMRFPNTFFYEGKLNLLPEHTEGHQFQTRPSIFEDWEHRDALEQALSKNRLLFIPTPAESGNPHQKTNQEEAQATARATQVIFNMLKKGNRPIHKGTLGIITPYRAQIALIKKAMQALELDDTLITIDTVERFQGGAKDFILISLCTNSERQLHALVSLSEEGVDRKLNVALTRAREVIILFGNPEVLQKNQVYENLITSCTWVDSIY